MVLKLFFLVDSAVEKKRILSNIGTSALDLERVFDDTEAIVVWIAAFDDFSVAN